MMESLPPDLGPSAQLPTPPLGEATPDQWRIRDLLLFFLFIIFAFFFSQFLALAGFAALKPLLGRDISLRSLQGSTMFAGVVLLIFYALLFAYAYLLIAVYYGAPFWEALHWRPLGFQKVLQYFAAGGLLSVAVMLMPPLLPDKSTFPLEKMFNSTNAAYVMAMFAVFVAPFMEEIFFRGFLFVFFEKHGGLRFAVVATALLFGGLHVQEYWGAWNHVLMIFLVGLVFSLARGLTGSLVPSVILHFAYNGIPMTLLFFGTHYFRMLPGITGF
jgi:CAAX protease family protein